MHPLAAPLLGALAVKPGMGGAAERRAPAPAHQPVADVVVDRYQVPGRRRAGGDGAKLGGEFRPDPLVGIDLDDPGAAAGVDPGMAARTFALPRALDDVVGEAGGDFARAVAAAVEHDDQLVGKAEAGEAVGKLGLLVAGHDQRRKQNPAAHAAALATRRHSSRAAASALSTDRLSISVSVVRWSKPGGNSSANGTAVCATAQWSPHGA